MNLPAFSLQPIVAYPSRAEPGKTYLMTVDFAATAGFSEQTWPYPEEEYPVYCLLDPGPLFSVQLLNQSDVVVHRFGGSYGPARFLLTAADEEGSGQVRLSVVNRAGVVMRVLPLAVEVKRGVAGDDAAVGTIVSPETAEQGAAVENKGDPEAVALASHYKLAGPPPWKQYRRDAPLIQCNYLPPSCQHDRGI